jgi:hypothetical protein
VYGCETWAIAEMDKKILSTVERKILRRIHESVVQRGIWGIGTDESISRHCGICGNVLDM